MSPAETITGQWACLYGNLAGDWVILHGPMGVIRPHRIDDMDFVGEPAEVLAESPRARASRTGMSLEHARAQVARECGITVEGMDAVRQGRRELWLSNDGWSALVRGALLARVPLEC